MPRWRLARDVSSLAGTRAFSPVRKLLLRAASATESANNPALCAWVEAHQRHPEAEILVVSLGTGNESKPVSYDDARHWGLAGWAPHLVDVIFDGPVPPTPARDVG